MLAMLNPGGALSVTVTVPEVGPAPAMSFTVSTYVAPIWPCVKLPACVFWMLRLAAVG